MKQEAFEQRYSESWEQFEKATGLLNGGARKRSASAENQHLWTGFDQQYRQICQHLAIARARRYSIELQQKLNQMALDGHRHFYSEKVPIAHTVLQFIVYGFPQAIRQRWKPIAVSFLLFFGVGTATAVGVYYNPDLIYYLMDPQQVGEFERMYDPTNDVLGRERNSGTDLMMFGFYISNNVSIGFQTYAGGLFFGLGTLFYLVFNGIYIGAVAGHLQRIGYGEPFWSFVSGHSALELLAIVIFGGVGLSLGRSLIAPGGYKRFHALRITARETLPLVYGGALMLLFAAFVEAYWSSMTTPPVRLKYAVGIAFWAAIAAYFSLAGKRQ
ncbi:MAG: stage II sporulation protein M [Pseudomonadota bacterium]